MARDKLRADVLLVETGLAESREKAQRIILAGQARIGQDRIGKPSQMIERAAAVSVDEPFPYVSRGALKILKALDVFVADVSGAVCLDVGASTGGFTDALLSRGAAYVYAVDVGYGQIADKLRSDSRVCVMERTNARYMTREMFPLSPTLAVMDVSFISIRLLIPTIFNIIGEHGRLLTLVKPQFEAGRGQVGKGGIVRKQEDHIRILEDAASSVSDLGFHINGTTFSPVRGQTGNIEFLFDISHKNHIEKDMTNGNLCGKIDPIIASDGKDAIIRLVAEAHNAFA
ncbi:MAG: TlyA family RNA methyltransferase [Oscillospiraceae bacterium]|jgi:23S rRNA (cytidine1920-2'-O)/16S rRNA (cytidine1409-2'-O)-methyltransferase|nr:TlyA family RNA methyltransferase [Oscillospiraceae bacterium]